VFSGLTAKLDPNLTFPERFFVSSSRFQEARYGENPDQRAAIYSIDGFASMADWKQLSGDALSFNNYLDIGSAYDILEGFEETPAAATVKHGNISGFAFAPKASDAYLLAHACDPEADFGGTVVFNRPVDRETARLVGKNDGAVEDGSVYTEIVIAPGFDQDALELLESKQKKKIRAIQADARPDYPLDLKVLQGAVLVQEKVDYRRKLDRSKLTIPTTRKPTAGALEKMLAAWEVVRRVPSNGIVVGNGRYEAGRGGLTQFWTLGVGTFRKRNGAVRIALDNAGERARGAVCASDGFFPFRDDVDYLGRAGVTDVIQPGGSVNDASVIEAADEYGIAMVFTHARAFRH
jgi:phosphoribosylaminoimidazolecarboxamide formyltransferase/IMP cyclohydrolase